MANGRSSVFRGAGKAAGKYRASQERGRGIEYAKAGAAASDQFNLEKMYETTDAIGEGIGLVSGMVDSAYSKKETGEAMKGMKATEKKQGFGDWLFGAEKEYDITKDGETMTLKQSELKTAWGTRKAEFAEEGKLSKKDKPTMLEEATQPKDKKPGIFSDQKGLVQGYTEGGKQKLRFGEQKGFDTKTTDWFSNLFKGGADKETTVDSNAQKPVTDAQLIPDPDSKSSVATPKQSDLDRVNMYKQKKWAPDDTINMSLWNQEKEATNLGELSLSPGRNWSNILGN